MSSCQLRPNRVAIGNNEDILTVRALGSGIVVCLYDERSKTGGVAYTLFPDSYARPESAGGRSPKYVVNLHAEHKTVKRREKKERNVERLNISGFRV